MAIQLPHKSMSIFAAINSSSSHLYFPENRSDDFTNKLVNPIKQDRHSRGLECALIDLYYHPSSTPHRDTIFGHEPDSNVIKILNQLRNDFFVSKTEMKIENFVTHCKNEAKRWGVAIEFKIHFSSEGTKFILVHGAEGYKLRMTPDYARSLGFTKEY